MTPAPKKHTFQMRTTPDERERWHAAAAARQMTATAWLRALADEAAATNASGRETAAALVALRTELARGVGNNLNQIAHRLHSTGHTDSTAIEEAARATRDAMREIERALRTIKPPRPRRAR
jgi:uncharacterized protein YhdP